MRLYIEKSAGIKLRGAGRKTLLAKEFQEMTDDRIDETELERYGIRRVPADVFEWGGYRYSNAHDALAAAKRNGAKANTQAQTK